MSTRKSHKAKRQWKSPAEPVKPESSLVKAGSSSSVPAKLVPTSDIVEAKDVPEKAETSDERSIVVLPPPKPEKPYWYRPPDSKARKLFEKIAVMRAAGRDDEFIARKLGTTAQSVRQYVYLAKMNKWADEDGEPVDLEAQMAMDVDRKLVRNIDRALDGGLTNWQTHEVTMGLMKVRRVVTDVEQGGQGQALPQVVAIQVVMPPIGEGNQQIVEDNVGGVPVFLEGEVGYVDGRTGAEPAGRPGPAGEEVSREPVAQDTESSTAGA